MVTVIADVPVIFTDTSMNNPTRHDWFFGDGTEVWYTKSGVVTHTYDIPGTYIIKHVSSNSYGVSNECTQTLDVISITPPPPPPPPPPEPPEPVEVPTIHMSVISDVPGTKLIVNGNTILLI